jgi:hypothetical protein
MLAASISPKVITLSCFPSIDAHRGGGIKVYPPSKIFAKLVNKNALKHQKGVPSPQNFHNPYIPSLPKSGKNLMDPPPGFLNHVHLSHIMNVLPRRHIF